MFKDAKNWVNHNKKMAKNKMSLAPMNRGENYVLLTMYQHKNYNAVQPTRIPSQRSIKVVDKNGKTKPMVSFIQWTRDVQQPVCIRLKGAFPKDTTSVPPAG